MESLRPCLFSRSQAFRSVTSTARPVVEACLAGPASAALRPVFTGVTLFRWDRGTGELELTQEGAEALGSSLGSCRRVSVAAAGLRRLLEAVGRPVPLADLGLELCGSPTLQGARDGASFAVECADTVGERVGTGLVARYSAGEPPGLSVNLERRKGLEAAPRARVEGILRALEANE